MAISMAIEKCCLCLKSVESSKDKKSRKRFHGTSCVFERDILGKLIKRSNYRFDIASFEELNDTEALLCAVCSRLLLRIHRLEDDFAKSTATIQEYLALLHTHYTASGTTAASRKRLLSDPGTEVSEEETLSVDEEDAISSMENTGNSNDVQACTTSLSPDVIVSLCKYLTN